MVQLQVGAAGRHAGAGRRSVMSAAVVGGQDAAGERPGEPHIAGPARLTAPRGTGTVAGRAVRVGKAYRPRAPTVRRPPHGHHHPVPTARCRCHWQHAVSKTERSPLPHHARVAALAQRFGAWRATGRLSYRPVTFRPAPGAGRSAVTAPAARRASVLPPCTAVVAARSSTARLLGWGVSASRPGPGPLPSLHGGDHPPAGARENLFRPE